MKQNQHVMTWLEALRDEAVSDTCSMLRMIEIMALLAKYSHGMTTI